MPHLIQPTAVNFPMKQFINLWMIFTTCFAAEKSFWMAENLRVHSIRRSSTCILSVYFQLLYSLLYLEKLLHWIRRSFSRYLLQLSFNDWKKFVYQIILLFLSVSLFIRTGPSTHRPTSCCGKQWRKVKHEHDIRFVKTQMEELRKIDTALRSLLFTIRWKAFPRPRNFPEETHLSAANPTAPTIGHAPSPTRPVELASTQSIERSYVSCRHSSLRNLRELKS